MIREVCRRKLFSQAQYLDCNVVGQAVPESFAAQVATECFGCAGIGRTIAYPERLEAEGVAFLRCVWEKGAAASLWALRGLLHLTCAKNGAVVRCGPCDALAAETSKPEEPSVAEATHSMEHLINSEEVEGDLDEEDTWGQRLKGSSKELEFRRLGLGRS